MIFLTFSTEQTVNRRFELEAFTRCIQFQTIKEQVLLSITETLERLRI